MSPRKQPESPSPVLLSEPSLVRTERIAVCGKSQTYQHGSVTHDSRQVDCSSEPTVKGIHECLSDRIHVHEWKEKVRLPGLTLEQWSLDKRENSERQPNLGRVVDMLQFKL